MQDSSGSALQRGHRFPRPTTPTTAITTATTTATTQATAPTPTTASASATASQPEQLQFQQPADLRSKSHASQSPPLLVEEESNASAGHLQPPAYPPPPIPPHSPFRTPETQSPAHTTNRQIAADTQSVATAPLSGPVDFASSAEIGLYRSGFEETRPISQDLSDEATEAALRLAAQSIRKKESFESSSESDSPIGFVSHQLRPIHYVTKPIVYEDFESRRRRVAEDFSLTTASSEHSGDTEHDLDDFQMPAFGDLTMDEEMEPTILTTTTNAEKREHLYKILVIGELGTGKTSFIKRYVHQFFSQNYRATIGVDFALKVLHWDANTIVRLQLWDIAGQERFGNMTRVYYKEAVGAFIVFDVTRSGTFDCVSKWKEDLDSKVQLPDGSPIPCILLANKCDQEKQGIVTQPEKMEEYVRENGFAGWFETSAKENTNIDEAARALVSKILLNDKLITAGDLADSERLNLNKSSDQSDGEAKNKCAC